jgi:3-keto-disaccharide hydrolase
MFARRYATVPFTLLIAMATIGPAAADQEVEIFNGKDFTGWKKRGGAATYRIEDGVIIGRSAPNTSNTFMTTDKEFGDFILELDFKIDNKDKFNSGIQIRSHSRPEKVKGEDQQRVYGYQVEIDTDPARPWTAGLYFEGGKLNDKYAGGKVKDEDWDRRAGWLNDLKKNEAAQKARKLGDWNHVKIEARGRHIRTWLNGVPAADFTDNDEKGFTPSGFVALQVHSVGGKTEPLEVRWKNIKLTVLD